jgi:hypothetical protein
MLALRDAERSLLSADIIDGGLPDLGTTAGQGEIDAAIGDAELIVIDNISTRSALGQGKRGRVLAPGPGMGAGAPARRSEHGAHSSRR